jgi:hypothetical protein
MPGRVPHSFAVVCGKDAAAPQALGGVYQGPIFSVRKKRDSKSDVKQWLPHRFAFREFAFVVQHVLKRPCN